jgi:hypothetical protein
MPWDVVDNPDRLKDDGVEPGWYEEGRPPGGHHRADLQAAGRLVPSGGRRLRDAERPCNEQPRRPSYDTFRAAASR